MRRSVGCQPSRRAWRNWPYGATRVGDRERDRRHAVDFDADRARGTPAPAQFRRRDEQDRDECEEDAFGSDPGNRLDSWGEAVHYSANSGWPLVRQTLPIRPGLRHAADCRCTVGARLQSQIPSAFCSILHRPPHEDRHCRRHRLSRQPPRRDVRRRRTRRPRADASLTPGDTRHDPGTGVPGITRVGWTPDGAAGPWAAVARGRRRRHQPVGRIARRRSAGRPRAKVEFRDSRILATRSLGHRNRRGARPPAVFISGSAVGYYGAVGREPMTEKDPPGTDFLAQLCVEWEQEARQAERPARASCCCEPASCSSGRAARCRR